MTDVVSMKISFTVLLAAICATSKAVVSNFFTCNERQISSSKRSNRNVLQPCIVLAQFEMPSVYIFVFYLFIYFIFFLLGGSRQFFVYY